VEILQFFDFARWWPSTVFDLFGAYLNHPQRVLDGFIVVQNLVVIDAAVSII